MVLARRNRPNQRRMTPRASVIVPLYNGRHLIEACLTSIPSGVEIVVVDDCSSDGAPEFVAERFPGVTLVRNERNLGFGSTSNRGLHAASGEIRIVLNSDARFTPGAMETLVATFDDPEVGVAGPRLVFGDGSHQTSAASFPTLGSIVAGSFLLNDIYRALRPGRRFRWELGMARADHLADRDVDWVKGACFAVRDACLAATGGFDEGYYMYVEETDLCLRARREGWRVRFVAGATVVHLGGGSTGDPAVHARRYLASERRFMHRAYGAGIDARWRLARLLGAVIKVVALAPPAVISSRARTRWRWQWAALRFVLGPSSGAGR